MIEPSQAHRVAQTLATNLQIERHPFDRCREYLRGERGLVRLPGNASDELRDIRKRSVKNILKAVVNTYTNDISVIGYANPDSTDNHEAWRIWNRLDFPSKQKAVTRSTVTYGVAYVSILPGSIRIGTPRNTTAVYEQTRDRFPLYALDTWIDADDKKHGLLVDERSYYVIRYGSAFSNTPESIEGPFSHGITLEGQPICPVVRFLNTETGDDDDLVQGDVEGLITDQEAINTVNFLRLVATKYGASPQKVLSQIETLPPEALEELENGSQTVWTFPDDVKVHEFSAADPAGYTNVLKEQLAHVAMTAGLNPTQVGSNDLVNLSGEALEAVDRTHKAHVRTKQAVLAGSWKLVLRILGSMEGLEDDASSEVLYASVESPTIGAVGDLISKAHPAGIPVKHLVGLIPGLTPQQVRNIKTDMDRAPVLDPVSTFMEEANALTAEGDQ